MREPVDWPTRDLVSHRVASTPERTAVIDAANGRAWSYRDLDERVDAVAARFATEADAETVDGGRVATLVDTRVGMASLLFGAMRAGVSLVPLNVDLEAASLAAQLDRVDPALLVCERGTERTAAEIADCPVASVDTPQSEGVTPLDTDNTPPDPAPLARDDEQVVLFTSGTTSDPKGVRLTVGNLVASATASAFRLGVSPEDRWLVALPTYHMGGLAPFVRAALYGTTVVVQRSFETGETATVLDEHDVTGVSLVPTMLSRLLDDGWEPPESVRTVLLGGGPADERLVERCRDRGVPVHPTYGMTETASQIATARPQTAFSHPGTVGQPLLFTDVTVVDGGEPSAPGERGELVVDGPTVTPGYLDEARTGAAFGEFGFHTGDLGYRDEDGRLWVVGRADDRIVTGGETVVAGDVAAAIRTIDGVEDAAVVGVPDAEWGERVAAVVAGEVTAAAVRSHCEAALAAYEVPKTIRVVDALTRTASGTVDRDAARRLFDADE
ncbi:class I adenylate-forming enzyme family protein [Haloarcula pelagica]|uniref:class I adenylate-forming enzyme family protein n=1 Tax=Haloarcula pelagica TaxID=3033389 RepID=UPI0024C24399|nr:AMP-binding protein [Halomicroarcula sp. YJ-61-S]